MLTKHVAGRVYDYDYCIGKAGRAGSSFAQPLDFALGSQKSLYLVSRGNEFSPSHGVTKFTMDHEVLWEDRGLSFGGGESPWPSSVAVDSSESVYVSDDYMNRIFLYDRDGDFLGGWGAGGRGAGELNGPFGLAFDEEDRLYVVDSLGHRVQRFTKEGRFLGG